MVSNYQALTKAKIYADDYWYAYTRLPQSYQEKNPVSYWFLFLTELESQGYEVQLAHNAKREKRSESMADVS